MKYFLNTKENYSGARSQILVGFSFMLFSVTAIAGNVSQIPLFLAPPVKPNIMLMLDNSGSMNNIVPDSPYDPSVIVNCPAPNQLAACDTSGCVQIKISGSKPYINYNGTTYTYGTATGQKCFATASQYSALLIADNKTHTAPSGKTGDADYTGNFLNWYFDASNTGAWTGTQKPGTKSRLEIVKQSGTDLVNSLDHVRLGLSTYYNSQDGGALLEAIEDLDINTSKKGDINTQINNLEPINNTPLSETLLDIGRYFATGNTGNLTLHPGKTNQASASVASVFTQGTKSDHQLYNSSGQTIVNPIEHSCQKSFAVLMTDGQPHLDRDINSLVRDYTGDCAATPSQCDSTPTDPNVERLPATPLPALSVKNYQNGTKKDRRYEWGGSDYLDDVAQALFDMDLRPDLTKSKAGEKSNLITYTIGFADPILANDPLLTDAAIRGGGQFKTAGDSAALTAAFAGIFDDIANQVELSSASTLSANSTRLDTTTKIYQAGFSSVDWSGFLKAFALSTTSEDTNGNGVKDSGEDTNGNGILDGIGSFGEKKWDMSFPAADTRRILSYNPAAVSTKGISFEWAELSTSQQAALTSADVLNYIRGDQAKEIPKTGGTFRARATVLGDIVNSDPLFIGKSDDFGYGILPGTEGTDYQKFRNDDTYSNYKGSRLDALYFGANDGMLHAVNSETGAELFAYLPNAVIPSLKKLTAEKYGCTQSGCLPHEYFVDGSPRAGDVYFSSLWHTVLLGSTGAGSSKAIFALDVTNPTSSMAISNVLWEITPSQAPVTANLADDTANKNPGFANNLGYTIPQPTTARMQNGKWAAIVANGYNSVSKKAVLFIVDVATGEIIRSIDTNVGDAAKPNGLSTPVPADVDGDRIVDYIYAGDLLGNLWKFDVADSDPSKWGVAFSSGTNPAPLFTACSAVTCSGTNFQPITAKPQLGRHPLGGLMVYFGTGKYFESGDHIVPSSPQAQSFYGIRDIGSVISGRSSLQMQKILAEQAFDTDSNGNNDFVLRATSETLVDYKGNALASPPVIAKKGWYMDLEPPTGGAKGERVVTAALVRGKRLMFVTMTPSADPCKAGGVSWIMELDAVEGKRLTDASFDTNNDGYVNVSDKRALVDTNGDGVVNSLDIAVAMSGSRHLNTDGSDQGMFKSVTIVKCENGTECRYTGDSETNKNKDVGSADDASGRQSWRQIR